MQLMIIRHGQSKANVDRRVYFYTKDQDILLTEEGERQAENILLPTDFPISAIYSSPYKRALATANIIKNKKNIKASIIQSPLIREQEYKYFKNTKDYDDITRERKEWGKFWYRFKNAESMADVYQRVVTFINNLKLKHNDDDIVLVVCHEVVIRMFYMYANNLSPEASEDLQFENCSVTYLKI